MAYWNTPDDDPFGEGPIDEIVTTIRWDKILLGLITLILIAGLWWRLK